jgi:hypothetical protein
VLSPGPKGAALNAETTNNVVVGTVNILSVPSGKYLAEDPNAIVIEERGAPSRLVEPDERLAG